MDDHNDHGLLFLSFWFLFSFLFGSFGDVFWQVWESFRYTPTPISDTPIENIFLSQDSCHNCDVRTAQPKIIMSFWSNFISAVCRMPCYPAAHLGRGILNSTMCIWDHRDHLRKIDDDLGALQWQLLSVDHSGPFWRSQQVQAPPIDGRTSGISRSGKMIPTSVLVGYWMTILCHRAAL